MRCLICPVSAGTLLNWFCPENLQRKVPRRHFKITWLTPLYLRGPHPISRVEPSHSQEELIWATWMQSGSFSHYSKHMTKGEGKSKALPPNSALYLALSYTDHIRPHQSVHLSQKPFCPHRSLLFRLGQQLTPNPDSMICFPAEKHGLRLGGADILATSHLAAKHSSSY